MVVLAQDEARRLRQHYIGTEHILLGLLREEEGLAARVLESLGVTAERVRAKVVEMVGQGEEPSTGQIPFTPRAKRVLELSLREALSLSHNYIGPEHVLLGLIRMQDGVAVEILRELNADPDQIRTEMLGMLSGPDVSATRGVRVVAVGSPRQMIAETWLGGIGMVLNSSLAGEIQSELKRAPDSGDLLLALACASDTLAGRALRNRGVGHDELPGLIERLRSEPHADEVQAPEVVQEVRRRLGLERNDDPPA